MVACSAERERSSETDKNAQHELRVNRHNLKYRRWNRWSFACIFGGPMPVILAAVKEFSQRVADELDDVAVKLNKGIKEKEYELRY